MKTFLALLAANLIVGLPAGAAGFVIGFDTGYDHSVQLAGQDGWTIDDPTPNLSFFVSVNRSVAGALGGYYDAPSGAQVKLSHPVGVPLTGSSFKVTMGIVGSSGNYPGRDAMAWCFVNSSGRKLLSVEIVPALFNPDLFNILWSDGNHPPDPTGRAIYSNAPYTLEVKFGPAIAGSVTFTTTITGSTSFSFGGVLAGAAEETWDSIEAQFIVKGASAGDNFMTFDNLSAVPPLNWDADGDGYTREMEAWFGTSDDNVASTPYPVMSHTTGGASLSFPSVPGHAYLMDSSDDLQTWITVAVTATTTTTVWLDPAGATPRHRYFRIRKP